ncbi:MAG: hypothetical protein KatS3mg131_3051 [Candidatus Tectimicrobiota bacterium]|nr:MAG: hypothetical protein KatS3mg131_3051 [Candidatus Tectomicrobia bacterium]
MAALTLALRLWVGLLALLWAAYPLVFSQARGIALLAAVTGAFAFVGWLLETPLLVVWGGGLGLGNFTLALVLTGQPLRLWAGLGAGLLLLALVDGTHRLTYLSRCHFAPRVLWPLYRSFAWLSALSLLCDLGIGLLVLLSPRSAAPADAGLVTVLGACLLVSGLAAFLSATDDDA